MAELRLIILIVLLTVLELSTSLRQETEELRKNTEELPLSKSLGYSIQHKLGKNLEDSRLGKEYLELYQEMMRVSQESLDKMQDDDDDRDVGKIKLDVRKRGASSPDRRHSMQQRRSAVGHRRARSQATRREKLNSQSLRSHQQHIRRSGQLYLDD